MAIFPHARAANQPPPLSGHDLFTANHPLAEALEREGGGGAADACSAFGKALSGTPLEWGRLANEFPPRLRTHDRFGERVDEVEYHPAYHDLLRLSRAHGAHAEPDDVARAVLFYLASQVEAGHGCPISMTHAAIAVVPEWEAGLRSREYEPELLPLAEKQALSFGMSMTERQGGSDVRTNTTTASPAGDGEYVLDGSKWFCSAPMSDAFLMLAQAPAGLSCFLVPRVLPDGTRNGIRIQRLKDKLGDRSNASSEIELTGAAAQLVGEEGRGVRTIVEMVVQTRLDCVLGTAAGMRAAVEQATHHAAHRVVFGKLLSEQPLMQNVLADLCVESEAATVLALRLARAYATGETAFARIATAVAKYWVCKRGPGARGRGARMPRGQRLRRGVRPAAHLPAAAAAVDLGRLGQRHLPRCVARAPTRARDDRGPARRARARPAARRRGGAAGRRRGRRPQARRAARPGTPGLAPDPGCPCGSRGCLRFRPDDLRHSSGRNRHSLDN